ncbi:hypothetical protein ACUOCP_18275 [Escherichia sp. R-CC3]
MDVKYAAVDTEVEIEIRNKRVKAVVFHRQRLNGYCFCGG